MYKMYTCSKGVSAGEEREEGREACVCEAVSNRLVRRLSREGDFRAETWRARRPEALGRLWEE